MQYIIQGIIDSVLKDQQQKILKYYTHLPCPDQIVAELKISKMTSDDISVEFIKFCRTKFNNRNRDSIYERKLLKHEKNDKPNRIILILESPHKDEYNFISDCTRVNGPAYGKTGENINRYLPEILKNIMLDYVNENEIKIYELVLINAVQYQCSLGEPTKKYRNKVFKAYMENEQIKNDFCFRIKQTLDSCAGPCIIINCCTKGDIRGTNHKIVSDTLEYMGLYFYESTHPSSWFNIINRRIN